jgi:serine/threonine protein kinase
MCIKSFAFLFSPLRLVVIPSTILFVASDAVHTDLQISLLDGDSCPEFARWLALRRSGITVDFQRIVRVNSGLSQLRDYVVNLSLFEKQSMIVQSDRVLNEIYCRSEDEFSIVVKSISLTEWFSRAQLENEIENFINLRHSCIAAPIGFVLPSESEVMEELKIVELYLDVVSLSDVILVSPEWWTATAKAKAVVGLVLGFRFVHSLGLIHGHLNSNNIHFDVDHHIQIAEFGLIGLEVRERKMGGFAGSGWTAQMDVHGFALIFFEILTGRSAKGETFLPPNIPKFVSKIITRGLWSKSKIKHSFCNIFDILKRNNFKIMEGVDSSEVFAFANWVESLEH